MKTMKAVVFKGENQIGVEEVPKPTPRAGEAAIRITTTTICGTDVHIVRGEYPVKPGLILGHEPVGVIDELGAGLKELHTVGQRVIVGAMTANTMWNASDRPICQRAANRLSIGNASGGHLRVARRRLEAQGKV